MSLVKALRIPALHGHVKPVSFAISQMYLDTSVSAGFLSFMEKKMLEIQFQEPVRGRGNSAHLGDR